jgi:hypothetical protein
MKAFACFDAFFPSSVFGSSSAKDIPLIARNTSNSSFHTDQLSLPSNETEISIPTPAISFAALAFLANLLN